MPTLHHCGVDNLATDEGFNVGSKFGAVFRGRARGVVLVGFFDDALRRGRIHRAGVGLPDEDWIVLAEELAEGGPRRTPAGIGR
jgi:hypothetical protein